ncbi:hypothetical protein Tco_0467956 [Tanacetum coccineum]
MVDAHFGKRLDLVENYVKDIVKDEVKSQLLQILPKEVSEFATPVIQSTITESLENVVLAKSSSQPKSTYEDAMSLTEFELKKILLDKMQKSKSYRATQEHRDLYDALKRDHEDKDKDEDPPAGSDQLLKRRKTSKDAEPSKGSKSKESKSSSSKGTMSQPKSNGKSAQAEESMFETTDNKMPQNQGSDLGNIDDQPNVEAALTHDCKITKAEKPPLSFDELMSTPINFLAYVMNNHVGPAFNLLKGTCRSRVELEYHFEECYKVVIDLLDWNNPEGQEYLFDLSKPLPKYTTSTTKTKAAKYDDIQGIKDMVLLLWSPVKHDVFFTKRTIAITYVKVMTWYDYGYLEDIVVRIEDHKLYKFKEGDFPRLNLRDIEDMLLLLHVVILKRVEDLQLGVESYQKKLNITRPETFRMDYLPKRRWSNLDKQRSRIMIKAIDKLQLERRLRGTWRSSLVGENTKKTSGCLNG